MLETNVHALIPNALFKMQMWDPNTSNYSSKEIIALKDHKNVYFGLSS